MSISADINRIDIALHGISADLASAAADGLGAEIDRRLGALSIGQRVFTKSARVDLAVLAIDPVILRGTPDAAALRGLLAERIARALHDELRAAGEEDA